MTNELQGMTLENITKACGGRYVGKPELLDSRITGAVTDSRKVEKGFLFVAIAGERVDGHDFAEQVFDKGALCMLAERELLNCKGPYILVDSTRMAFQKIAAFYRQQLTIPVVGITGSVGKTSTKEMIASVLAEKYKVQKTAGNFNNEIGLPLTLFTIGPEHEAAVTEMGISGFGEMDRLAAMSQPDIMVITNIGTCHLDNLGDRDGVLKAKTECFAHLQPAGLAVLNGDDDKLITQQSVRGRRPVFYGLGKEMADKNSKEVFATDITNLGFDGMKAVIHTPQGSFPVTIHIPGEHNVYNALAATAVALKLGLSPEEIARGIEKARTIAGRTNVIRAKGLTVIDDCYNANPMSMKTSVRTLSHANGRTIAVLGDMGELGEDTRALHAEVGTCVGEEAIDALFAAGDLAEEYGRAATKINPDCLVVYEKDRDTMLKKLMAFVKEGDFILVKASHFMEFPKVVDALVK